MVRAIVYDDGVYFEWSTVVDAPVTHAMTREEMLWHRVNGGQRAWEAEASLARAELNGTSFIDGITLDSLKRFNRAGENEAHLPWPEVIALVVAERPVRHNSRVH